MITACDNDHFMWDCLELLQVAETQTETTAVITPVYGTVHLL